MGEPPWDAIITYDADWTVLTWDAGAQRLYDWTPEEAIGRRAWEVHPGDGDRLGRMAEINRRGFWEGVAVVAAKGNRHVAIYSRVEKWGGGFRALVRELPTPPDYPEVGDPSLG